MSIRLRALRHRWGIAAPKLTVGLHVPWYWRALAIAAASGLLLVLAAWMYDAGRRFAGFDASTAQSELATLRARAAALEEELRRLRAITTSSDSRLQIEKSAQAQLAKQMKVLQAENARLREDLAFFENLAASAGEDKLAVSGFKVEPDLVPGEYRYRVLVTLGGRKEREFSGRLQLVVDMQLGDRDVTLMVPPDDKTDEAAYRVRFKRFYRAEGSFRVDPKAKVRSVQVRVFDQGAAQPRATESYTLS
jgi:hypothetical protein